MFHVRGGGVVPKPKTRPRDVFDLNLASVLNQNSDESNELSILTAQKDWFKM